MIIWDMVKSVRHIPEVKALKKDEIISVKSTLGKNRKKPPKPKKQVSDYSFNDNNTTGLKRALVLLPIIIIGVIITALIVGIHQYTSIYSKTPHNTEDKIESSEASKFDESNLLMIVSPDNPLPSDYKPQLETYDGERFDKNIIPMLRALMYQSEKDGVFLKISEGYVTSDVQHERYMDEVQRLKAREGYGEARAMEEAEKTVPMENHSEMQSGLAVKFSSLKNSDFASSEEYHWLEHNCIKYGFILRYPEDKESSTDFAFDPTHFRYVGTENAQKMRSLNMTLDEYVSYLNARG